MHVLVMAKEPIPGRVKTRLCPPCTPEEAAGLAEAALADTLDAVVACGADRRVVALAGDPGDWLPAGFEVVPQVGDGLGQRLDAAWSTVGGPGLQIGMDTPQIDADLLDRSLDRLTRASCVLGVATDGGWWAIGLHDPVPGLFAPVPMSVPDTGARQRARCEAAGLTVTDLPRLTDVDQVDDALTVAGLAPRGRFAARVAALELESRTGGASPAA